MPGWSFEIIHIFFLEKSQSIEEGFHPPVGGREILRKNENEKHFDFQN